MTPLKNSFQLPIATMLMLVAALGIVIGCGGSGSSATSTNSTATATATGTATGTATATSTATATGTATGTATATSTATGTATGTSATGSTGSPLGPNELVYTTKNVSGLLSIRAVKPDGTGDAKIADYPSKSFLAVAPNPTKAEYAFAYGTSQGNIEIYTNSTVSLTGATQITHLVMDDVTCIQYSSDGKKIIFVGSYGNKAPYPYELYSMNSNGAGILPLAPADDAYLASDNVTLCFASGDGAHDQIWTGTITGANMKQITNDGTSHRLPQISKDLKSIAWTSGVAIFKANIDGSSVKQLTASGGLTSSVSAPCWNQSGTEIGYEVSASFQLSSQGLYTVKSDGTAAPQLIFKVQPSGYLYWTDANAFFIARP